MSKIIAVDFDEVLMESLRGLIEFARQQYGFDRKYEGITNYMLSKNDHIGVSLEFSLQIFDEYLFSPLANTCTPVQGAKEELLALQNKGWSPVVVTARKLSLKDVTYNQLEKRYPGIFHEVYFAEHYTDNHIPKSELCKRAGAKCLIEDNFDYALEAADKNIQTLLLEKPWNISLDSQNPYLHKIKNWSQVHEKLG